MGNTERLEFFLNRDRIDCKEHEANKNSSAPFDGLAPVVQNVFRNRPCDFGRGALAMGSREPGQGVTPAAISGLSHVWGSPVRRRGAISSQGRLCVGRPFFMS